jgi:hypothetical protein
VRVIENRDHVTEHSVLHQLGQLVREDRGALGLPAVERLAGRLALFVSANIH